MDGQEARAMTSPTARSAPQSKTTSQSGAIGRFAELRKKTSSVSDGATPSRKVSSALSSRKQQQQQQSPGRKATVKRASLFRLSFGGHLSSDAGETPPKAASSPLLENVPSPLATCSSLDPHDRNSHTAHQLEHHPHDSHYEQQQHEDSSRQTSPLEKRGAAAAADVAVVVQEALSSSLQQGTSRGSSIKSSQVRNETADTMTETSATLASASPRRLRAVLNRSAVSGSGASSLIMRNGVSGSGRLSRGTATGGSGSLARGAGGGGGERVSIGSGSRSPDVQPATPNKGKGRVMSPAQEKYHLRTFQLYAVGKRDAQHLNEKGVEKFLRHIGDKHTTPADVFAYVNRTRAAAAEGAAGGANSGGKTSKQVVTFEEIHKYLVEFRNAPPGDEQHTADDSAMIFDMLDLNKNGVIEFDEFRHILNGFTPNQESFTEREVRVVYRAIDKSGDGTISRAELMQFLSELLAKGS